MHTRWTLAAVALAALALGVAAFALNNGASAPSDTLAEERIALLEAQVAEMARKFEDRVQDAPDLIGQGVPSLIPSAPPADRGRTNAADSEAAPRTAKDDEALAEIVEAAVARKARQMQEEMRVKRNKKPPIELLTKMLELTEAQKAVTERVVVDGQQQVYDALDTRTDDGTNLMDELVEVVAKRFVEPGKDHGIGKWFQRIAREKMPGTDVTYAARIESVKNSMRETFKREWSAEQYREFKEWGVDPTEIEQVPGSPYTTLGERIKDRARVLGADLPAEK